MLENYSQKLLLSYQHHYNVHPVSKHHLPLIAKCDLEMRNARYILTKKAEIWSAENYEFVYLFSTKHLSPELCQQCLDFASEEGFARITPHSNHMVSYITVIIISQEAEAQAKSILQKYKKRRSYRFSFHGWGELSSVLIEVKGENNLEFCSNRAGKSNVKQLKKILVEKRT